MGVLRRANLEDLDSVIELKMKMFAEVGAIPFLAENAREKIKETYSNLYLNEKAAHFVIVQNGKVVACAGGVLKDDIPQCFFKIPHYGFLVDVYTEREFRNEGFATKLTEAVINWLTIKGVSIIKLLPGEQARSIYSKMGFEDSGDMILRLDRK